MQHALCWVLALAWAVAPEEKRLQRQITIDRELLVKAKEDKETIHKEIGETKLQEANLTDQLKIVQHEDAEVEELVHQEEENDKVALAASVASAKANISAMTTEKEKTKAELQEAEKKVEETRVENEALHEKVATASGSLGGLLETRSTAFSQQSGADRIYGKGETVRIAVDSHGGLLEAHSTADWADIRSDASRVPSPGAERFLNADGLHGMSAEDKANAIANNLRERQKEVEAQAAAQAKRNKKRASAALVTPVLAKKWQSKTRARSQPATNIFKAYISYAGRSDEACTFEKSVGPTGEKPHRVVFQPDIDEELKYEYKTFTDNDKGKFESNNENGSCIIEKKGRDWQVAVRGTSFTFGPEKFQRV